MIDVGKDFYVAASGAIPLFDFPEGIKEQFVPFDLWSAQERASGLGQKEIVFWLYQFEIFFSIIVWALLILSIRQKFKR